MATDSWATRLRHDSDATFREWGLEFSTALATVGLVQTADTGQINWGTVAKPGTTNTVAGYEIWRFDDAQQATAPIYLRFDYGTGSNTTTPLLRVTVGTGSDGSGTITGTALTTAQRVHGGSGLTNNDNLVNSYMCANEGFFGFSWKQTKQVEGSFFVCRTCDATGTPDADGALVFWGASAGQTCQTQALRFAATAQAYTLRSVLSETLLGFMPQALSPSLVGTDIQVCLGWTIKPQVVPLFGVCGVLDVEVADGNTFSVTLVGTTPRTYMAMTGEFGPFGPGNSTAGGQLKFAMLWE